MEASISPAHARRRSNNWTARRASAQT